MQATLIQQVVASRDNCLGIYLFARQTHHIDIDGTKYQLLMYGKIQDVIDEQSEDSEPWIPLRKNGLPMFLPYLGITDEFKKNIYVVGDGTKHYYQGRGELFCKFNQQGSELTLESFDKTCRSTRKGQSIEFPDLGLAGRWEGANSFEETVSGKERIRTSTMAHLATTDESMTIDPIITMCILAQLFMDDRRSSG